MLGNTVVQPAKNQATGILRNATIPVSLKYLSNFWCSIEMSIINCKIELKWTKYRILSANSNNNANNNPNNIIFTIKDTKLYVPVVILSAKDNKKLSKLLSKGLDTDPKAIQHI